MWDTAIVVLILLVVAFIALRGLIKTFKGKGGCSGSCACKGRSQPGDAGHMEVVHLKDLRDRNRT